MTLLEPAVQWGAANGPPNWIFVVALLTSPARWSKKVLDVVNSRIDL